MAWRFDRFCEALRAKLTNVDSNLAALRAKIEGQVQNSEKEIRSHLAGVQRRIKLDRTQVSAARAEVKIWVEGRKTATTDKIAEWKTKRNTSELQNWADQVERYAEATIEVALAAVDEAEQAALEAWLARQDADPALAKNRK